MLQEIITYLIIAAAVLWAVLKVYQRFFKRPRQSAKINFRKDKISMVHNCTDCSAADCELRDLPKKLIEEHADQCDENAVKS